MKKSRIDFPTNGSICRLTRRTQLQIVSAGVLLIWNRNPCLRWKTTDDPRIKSANGSIWAGSTLTEKLARTKIVARKTDFG